MSKRNSSRPKPRPPQRSTTSERKVDMRVFATVSASDKTTVIRLVQSNYQISTGAGGTIAAVQVCGSGQAQSSCPDFASFANLFALYRVRAMRVQLKPFYVCNTTSIVVPASVAIGEFRGGLGGATYNSLRQSPTGKIYSGYKSAMLSCDWDKDPDAHLWSATTAAVPTLETYGFTACGNSIASSTNTYVWSVDVDYIVEFRNAY